MLFILFFLKALVRTELNSYSLFALKFERKGSASGNVCSTQSIVSELPAVKIKIRLRDSQSER